MRRPEIGMSEFAETIEKNLSFLTENDCHFLKKNKFISISGKLQNFTTLLRKLNTRNTDEHIAPPHIKQFLKLLLDDEMDDLFQQMFHFGGAMFLLGVHYCSIKALLSNPEFYAQNSLDTFSKELKQFKADGTIKGMKTMLTSACCKQSQASTSAGSSRSAKRNLVQLLESDDEEQEDQPPPKRSSSKDKSKKDKLSGQ